MIGGRPTLPLAALFAAMFAGACDVPFSPTAQGEAGFSVFGYLDAAADTQWVRVMPIRSLMLTSPDSFGITVTLEHLGTGRVIGLRDSVFNFSHHVNSELDSEGAYVHNFWTAERIEPGATYRFSAIRDGEEPAEAVVEIPPDYQVEVWLRKDRSVSDFLELTGLKHVPFVAADAYFDDQCGPGIDTVRFERSSSDEEGHLIQIAKEEVAPRGGCGVPDLEKRELRVVGSEAEWPFGQEYSPWGLAVPDRPSNIKNAVGFLGGVLTKVVPYENCAFEGGTGGGVPNHCRLPYGPESATLTGTVTETRCGDGLIDSVTVELRELDREPPEVRKIRTTLSNPAGEFQIGALEAGVRYAMKVRAKPEPDPFWGEVDVYTLRYDTLEFTPGEQAVYGALLRRLTDCRLKP